MAYLSLSRRAALDFGETERFSVEKWGRRVAEEYLDEIEEALVRLRETPSLLRSTMVRTSCSSWNISCASYKEVYSHANSPYGTLNGYELD